MQGIHDKFRLFASSRRANQVSPERAFREIGILNFTFCMPH